MTAGIKTTSLLQQSDSWPDATKKSLENGFGAPFFQSIWQPIRGAEDPLQYIGR
jgi:hypothetical protein